MLSSKPRWDQWLAGNDPPVLLAIWPCFVSATIQLLGFNMSNNFLPSHPIAIFTSNKWGKSWSTIGFWDKAMCRLSILELVMNQGRHSVQARLKMADQKFNLPGIDVFRFHIENTTKEFLRGLIHRIQWPSANLLPRFPVFALPFWDILR